MKISFCSIAFQKDKWGNQNRPAVEVPLDKIIPQVREAGYDGLEIWHGHLRELNDAEKRSVADQLRDSGLAVPMVSPYFNFTTSDETAAASVGHGLEVLEDARLLGARAVRVFTGKQSSERASEEEWARATEGLQQLCDASLTDGILWLLETHSWNLMDTVDGTLRLLDMVDRPNLKVNFQPATFGQSHEEALQKLAPHTRHVHATNRRDGKTAGLEEGDLDWPAILQSLREHGFNDFVSVEWMGPEPAEAVRREAAFLKRHI